MQTESMYINNIVKINIKGTTEKIGEIKRNQPHITNQIIIPRAKLHAQVPESRTSQGAAV